MIDCAKYYVEYRDRTPVYLRQWPFNEPWRITDISETSGGFIYEVENIVTGTTVNVMGKDISLDSKYGKVEEEKSVNTDSIRYAKFYKEAMSYEQFYGLGHRAGKLNIALRCFLAYRKIIFSGPCTIVIWADGTKTMARVSEGEEFDPEKGVAICFMKRMLDHTVTNKILREAHDQYRVLNFDKQIIEPNEELLEKIGCPNPGYTVSSEEIHRHLSKKEENNGVHEA